MTDTCVSSLLLSSSRNTAVIAIFTILNVRQAVSTRRQLTPRQDEAISFDNSLLRVKQTYAQSAAAATEKNELFQRKVENDQRIREQVNVLRGGISRAPPSSIPPAKLRSRNGGKFQPILIATYVARSASRWLSHGFLPL